jgi:hypothetical protein
LLLLSVNILFPAAKRKGQNGGSGLRNFRAGFALLAPLGFTGRDALASQQQAAATG